MTSGNIDILHIILQSGIVVKLVLLLLIIASFLSWAIIFSKSKFLKNITKLNKEFLSFFESSHSMSEVNGKCGEFTPSPYATIFTEGHNELQRMKEKSEESEIDFSSYYAQSGTEAIERSIQKASSNSNILLEKNLAVLASISSVSPFIGLFGTVWGIIDSFRGLSQGGGTIEAVAPGIAEALVATAVGLAAAIPANWFYNYFSSQVSEITASMNGFSQDFLNRIDRSILLKKK